MARGVLVVSGVNIGSNRVNLCSIGEAYDRDLPIGSFPLSCNANDPAFLKLRLTPPVVQEAGEHLYKALVEHEPLRDFFVMTNPGAGSGAAPAEFLLYIRTDVPDAEAFPWEIMYEQKKQFMALDGRWPIARQVGTTGRPKPLTRFIGATLRMAVVLAAAQENGATEWAGIAAAIDAHEVPVDLLVIVSEEATKVAVEANAADWKAKALPRTVTVQFAADADTLMQALRAHVPNIVHFFCHGQSEGESFLEVESRADRRAKKASGSIQLKTTTLGILGQIQALWLVVLNCCKGGSATPQLHSMAREIVAANVPAVAAMRESVDVSDANVFSEHFYGGLLPQLKATFALVLKAPAKTLKFQEIVWVRAMHRARRELIKGDRKPESSVQWTYPVLYVHRDDLELAHRELNPLSQDQRVELLAEVDMMRALRSTYDLTQDPEAPEQIAKLDVRIREIEQLLATG